MENLIERPYLQQDVSYDIVKLSDNKIKIVIQWNNAPTKGYKIRIQSVEVQGDQIKVIYKKYYPSADSIYGQAICKPSDSWEGTLDIDYEKYTVTLYHLDQ